MKNLNIRSKRAIGALLHFVILVSLTCITTGVRGQGKSTEPQKPLAPNIASQNLAKSVLVKGHNRYHAYVTIDKAVQDAVRLQKSSRTPAERKISSDLLEVSRQIKLDGSIAANASKSQTQAANRVAASQSRTVQADETGRIYVYVTASHGHTTAEATAQVQQLGGSVDIANEKFRIMQVWIDPTKIADLAGSDVIAQIRPVIDPIVNTGSVESEGVPRMRDDVAQNVFSVDGTGVKIGILSDDCGSISGEFNTDQTSGDIGSDAVLYDDPFNDTHEGLAMMEIAQDMAPGSELYFATAFEGEVQFADNIKGLAADGCNVISDDVSYFDEPVYEDGILAQAVDDVTADGVLYTSSAGNNGYARNIYSTYANTTADAGPLAGDDVCDIDGSGTYLQPLYIGAGGTAEISLHWDDQYGASGNDFDLYLVDETNSTILASSTNTQDGTEDPWEFLEYTNSDTNTILTYLVIVKNNISGTDPNPTPRYKLDAYGYINLENAFAQSSIYGHAAAASCVSAGAMDQFVPSYNQIEFFSSQGPVNMVDFTPGDGSSGRPILETRNKPDVSAINGVSTNVWLNLGPIEGYFYGTSAATPHVAGVAALLLQKFPSLTPAETFSALQAGCIDYTFGSNDPDVYGAGRLDAFKTIALASDGITAADGTTYRTEFTTPSGYIPDGGSTSSSVTFPTTNTTADSVYLSVTVDNHYNLGDLYFILTAPDGSTVLAMNQPYNGDGTSEAIDPNVVLADLAVNPIEAVNTAGAETFGYFIPNKLLSDNYGFKGRVLDGTWTLSVGDNDINGITGVLQDWGMYTKTGLPTLALSSDPQYIYSTDHSLKEINVNETVYNGTSPSIVLESVTSSEPDAGTGPYDVPDDIQNATTGVNTTTFDLRAETAPLSKGRIYTATYTLSDVNGFSQDFSFEIPSLVHAGHVFTGPFQSSPNVVLNIPIPNPVVGTTTIDYSLPDATDVFLKIFDMRGKWQKNLDYGSKAAGNYSVSWDGTRADGVLLPDGPYIYQLNADNVLRSGVITLNH